MQNEFTKLILEEDTQLLEYLDFLSKIIKKYKLKNNFFNSIKEVPQEENQKYKIFIKEMLEDTILWYFFREIGKEIFEDLATYEYYALEYYDFYLKTKEFPFKQIEKLNESEEEIKEYLKEYYKEKGLKIKWGELKWQTIK